MPSSHRLSASELRAVFPAYGEMLAAMHLAHAMTSSGVPFALLAASLLLATLLYEGVLHVLGGKTHQAPVVAAVAEGSAPCANEQGLSTSL